MNPRNASPCSAVNMTHTLRMTRRGFKRSHGEQEGFPWVRQEIHQWREKLGLHNIGIINLLDYSSYVSLSKLINRKMLGRRSRLIYIYMLTSQCFITFAKNFYRWDMAGLANFFEMLEIPDGTGIT